MSEPCNQNDHRPSKHAEALERTVIRLLAEVIEARRKDRVTGDYRLKLVHVNGELRDVHVDDHQRLRKG